MGKRWRWGVILDAGSSGTRVYIYKWKDPVREQKDGDPETLRSLPKLKTHPHWTKKIRPGISSFAERPEDIGDDHLQKLIDHALSIVPAERVPDTPFFLMATAGMRLLPELQQRAIVDNVCAYIRASTKFSLPNCHQQVQVIPGETEGLYGWIATNYLLGGFDKPQDHDHGKGHHTYGFLDMGGASAQIAFAPNATEAVKHANDLKLLRMRKVGGKADEHQVFTATWLGFGANQARQRYTKALVEKYETNVQEIPDPCLPNGIRTALTGEIVKIVPSDNVAPTLIGTGRFDQCLVETFPLLSKDAPCVDQPCLLDGKHVPAIDFDVNHFIGVSEYWHMTHGMFADPKHAAYDFNTYQRNVMRFCSRDWSEIEEGGVANVKASKSERELKNAQEACFKASWFINMLHDGIGIPRVGLEHTGSAGLNVSKSTLKNAQAKGFLDPFQAVDEIDHIEVSWTLGPMVLYASGQVPPTGAALPVGFGSNIKDKIPADFQYAGSNYNMSIPGSKWSDAADDIIETATSARGPSLLIFLLVGLLLAFLLRHRERRQRIYGWVVRGSRRRRKGKAMSPRKPFKNGPLAPIANKIFGRSPGSPTYERVAEEGYDLHQFEIGDAGDSDDGSGHGTEGHGSTILMSSRNSSSIDVLKSLGNKNRVSGMSTPKLSPELRADDLRKGKSATGLDRSGLVVRTESSCRLGPSHLLSSSTGRRSRAPSPSRRLS